MYICLHCDQLFSDDDMRYRPIARHPYGEGYAYEYGDCCPYCNSYEIAEAFQCDRCGEWQPNDCLIQHEDERICADCLKEIESEENPYKDIIDPFKIVDAMIGA